MAKYNVAYAGAGGVPMAVPEICCQYVSPKVKTLLRIMIESASIRAAMGMDGNAALLFFR
jgi:hypothetical protein